MFHVLDRSRTLRRQASGGISDVCGGEAYKDDVGYASCHEDSDGVTHEAGDVRVEDIVRETG